MDIRRSGTLAVLVLGLAAAAAAQENAGVNGGAGVTAPAQARQPADDSARGIDVSRLPIDVERIHKQLRQTTIREDHNGLNLRYMIDVYGMAPRIELFTTRDNLLYGPAPYGAPTHSDILQMITPQEHRAPAADFGALFRWLADKGKKDKK